jgi:hypothetical protein
LSSLFGAGFTIATCVAAGLLLLRWVSAPFDRVEQLLFAFLGGAACVSTVVFLLCVMGQARPGVYLTLGVALLAAALRRRPKAEVDFKPLPKSSWIYFVVLGALFVVYFFHAIAPEVSPDGSGYHLGNVVRIAERHGFAWDYHSIYSAFPQGLEMLFVIAYSLGAMPSAAVVHLAFLCALAGLLICSGRRFGFARAGLFASVLVFASPVIGLVGSSAYNDVALATCIYAVFYLTQVEDQNCSDKLLILIGLLAGYCLAIKYTGWLVLPYALVMLRGRGWTRILPTAALIAGPWFVRNWLWIGNPAAPFLNRWFPNWLYTPQLEAAYLQDLRRVEGFHHWWEWPLDLTIFGAKLPGFLGPVFLLAPLALLALRYQLGRKLLLSGCLFAAIFWLNPAARFLIPAIPFVAMAMGIAMQNSPGVLPALAVFHGLLALPAMMPSFCADWAWRIREIPVRITEADYLRRYIPDYRLKVRVAGLVPKEQKIFSFTTQPEAYLRRHTVVGYESAEGDRIGAAILRGENPKRFGVDWLLLNDRDFNSAAIKNDLNSIGLTEIERGDETTLYRID